MAEIELVIKIDEELYKGIKRRDGSLETEYVCDELMKAIDNGIPKTGKWIDEADKIDAQFGRHTYKCSKCGKYAEYFISGTEVWWDRIKPNYCPNCGAKMEVSE